MDAIHTWWVGLDVRKRPVESAVGRMEPDGAVQVKIQQFATMTEDLLKLVESLKAQGVTHVAMESTGVFWKPILRAL
jgi:transposase